MTKTQPAACLHGLSLAGLLEKVTLKVGYLAEKLHERVVARHVARVAVGDGGARLTLPGAAAVLGLEEGAAGRAEERAGFGARAAHRAGCPGGSCGGFV